MDPMSFMSMLGITDGGIKDIGKAGISVLDRQNDVPLLDPAFYGQQNASGSNANLDKSLGKDARKVAGISEGGAAPQLQNNGANATEGAATSGVMDYLKNIGGSLLKYLGLGV